MTETLTRVPQAFSRAFEPAPECLDFETVFETHAAFLWRCLQALGVPPALLEDAVQDVFIVVARRLTEFQGRAQLTTWLYAVAYRTAQNYRRRTSRHDRHARLDSEPLITRSDPSEAVADAEAERFVGDFIERLDEARRPLFVFCVVEGGSVPEVAEALGLNLNTAYSRLRSAKREFRQALLALHGSDHEP